MRNRIAETVDSLRTQTNNALAGLQTYATTLGLQTVTHAAMAELSALNSSQKTFNSERAKLSADRAALRGLIKNSRDYLLLAREILKPHLGRQHSMAWVELGFLTSLEIPVTASKLQPLLLGVAAHLTAHPERQNEALNIMAARATTASNDITNTRNDVNAQKTKVAAAKAVRAQKIATLRKMLRGVLNELALKVDPLDERYLAFGFNRPGQLATPPAPEEVKVVLIGPTAVSVKWERAPRASHYRVWKQAPGVDEAFIAVGSPGDLDFTIEDLPGNSGVAIAVSAVNNGGESARSASVTIAMP